MGKMSKQTYLVRGRYFALYKNGKHAGEVSYCGKQEAKDAETAIRLAAGDEAAKHDYRAFMWLHAEAEPVNPDP